MAQKTTTQSPTNAINTNDWNLDYFHFAQPCKGINLASLHDYESYTEVVFYCELNNNPGYHFYSILCSSERQVLKTLVLLIWQKKSKKAHENARDP